MRHRHLLFAIALIAALHVRGGEAPAVEVNEDGCVGARVIDYLERHGDYGQIDPEALLYLTRVEHDRRVLAARQGIGADAISGSVWSSIGPTNGAGRATALALHPTIPDTAIIGAAGGGAWKTTNRGATWTPLTETLANLSVGAIAYAPSDPNRVYLGTGEGGYAGDFIPGIGLLTSDDGGTTWTLPSSVLATMFYRVNVHPVRPNELLVATNKGALRSTSGANGPWTTVIASSPAAGVGYGDVTDIVRDPSDPQVLYAATWDRDRWCARANCPGLSNFASPTILKSVNGGVTWAFAASGFPFSTSTVRSGRISLAIAPSSPYTLYALTSLFDADSGRTHSEVYKTTDGGASWAATGLASSSDGRVSNLLGEQGWYDNTIVVAPGDANTVIAGGVQYARTTNGGTTWSFPFNGSSPHTDVHDLRYDLLDTLWIANDGGIWISTDHASTASSRNAGLVTRQYYAMSMDGVNRRRILAGTQDNGTNLRNDGGGTVWSSFSGGDGFQCLINPDAPGVAYSTFQFAELLRTKTAAALTPLTSPSGPVFDSAEKKPFFSVLAVDPSNSATLYLASSRVWKSTTGGDAWVPLPTTIAGAGTWTENTIRAIAIAPSDPATIVVAKGASVYRTTDGGAVWAILPNGLPGKTITNIEISPVDRGTVYVTAAGTSGASVYVTTNGGSSWNPRAEGLPPFSALVVRFDPTDPSTLYAGTDVGVYRTSDGGATWSPFGTGMPAVSVYDLRLLPDGSVVRAATHGRGIWELAVTDVDNSAPLVAITAPATLSVARGSVLTFNGSVLDPNGDGYAIKWTFPDDWSAKSGVTSAVHTFDRPGTWPVSLTATDSHGAVGGAEVTVNVTESSDDCATPLVIPAAGPFPWSVTLNAEVASAQTGFEPPTGGSCYPFRPLHTMWLSFTPEVSGSYIFSLCTSRVAGFIAAYSGPACGPHAALDMCLADTQLTGNCATDPTSSLDLTAGTQYRFFVSSYFSNSFGPITVTIQRGDSIPAALRSVSPGTGPLAGGTRVLLTGSGFTDGATVNFGGVPATSVTVLSPTLIAATVPPHAPGNVDVAVHTATATTTSSRAFTYAEAPVPSARRRATRH
jgi:photosystem II stability/assembly factor-like uncharacterized protein